VGRPERIVIDIVTRDNGFHEVGVQYQPVTSEWTPVDEQVAAEIALATLCGKAIELRLQRGQRVPGALLALDDAKTFMEFF
jgi:hypothetical protein